MVCQYITTVSTFNCLNNCAPEYICIKCNLFTSSLNYSLRTADNEKTELIYS